MRNNLILKTKGIVKLRKGSTLKQGGSFRGSSVRQITPGNPHFGMTISPIVQTSGYFMGSSIESSKPVRKNLKFIR